MFLLVLRTEEEKCLQINFSKDIWLYWGQSYQRRLVFSIVNKNIVMFNLFN